MSKSEKVRARERVAIAKDALAWIEAGVLIPKEMVYVQPIDPKRRYQAQSQFDKQLRDVVLGPCRVCVKGALFLAKAVRYDKVLASDLGIRIRFLSTFDKGGSMTEHFSVEQLTSIEQVFEGWDAAKEWKMRHPDPKERLQAILRNIIDNRGTFLP